jgi:hypothetical protein
VQCRNPSPGSAAPTRGENGERRGVLPRRFCGNPSLYTDGRPSPPLQSGTRYSTTVPHSVPHFDPQMPFTGLIEEKHCTARPFGIVRIESDSTNPRVVAFGALVQRVFAPSFFSFSIQQGRGRDDDDTVLGRCCRSFPDKSQ